MVLISQLTPWSSLSWDLSHKKINIIYTVIYIHILSYLLVDMYVDCSQVFILCTVNDKRSFTYSTYIKHKLLIWSDDSAAVMIRGRQFLLSYQYCFKLLSEYPCTKVVLIMFINMYMYRHCNQYMTSHCDVMFKTMQYMMSHVPNIYMKLCIMYPESFAVYHAYILIISFPLYCQKVLIDWHAHVFSLIIPFAGENSERIIWRISKTYMSIVLGDY